jgi:hypothetical protein
MNYYVARNGQTYGPYSEETVRKYLSEGSMQASDMARSDAMPSWTPLAQLLGLAASPAPPPVYAPPLSGANQPPSLHWAIVLVVAAFSSGLFITVWAFIQANWIKSIDPASRATRDLIFGIVFPIAGIIVFIPLAAVGGMKLSSDTSSVVGMGSIGTGLMVFFALIVVGFIFNLKAFFGMRDSMLRYYNSTEPINLHLSPIMTFFFNVLYLQYHMTRIADWKRTGTLGQ